MSADMPRTAPPPERAELKRKAAWMLGLDMDFSEFYRLARREEADMEQEFGQKYVEYKQRTGMFLPRLLPARRLQKASAL